MIKNKSTMNSNMVFGTVLFLGFLLMWGCSKEVAPPEIEPAPEVVEQIPATEPEPEPQDIDVVQEDGFGIQENNSGIQEGEFLTESSEPVVEEEIAAVIPEPEPEPIMEEPMVEEPAFEPMVEEPAFEPVVEEPVVEEPVVEEVVEAPPVMEMQEEVFVAPEPEPLQEARTLPFEEEKQLQDIHFYYDRDILDRIFISTMTVIVWMPKPNPSLPPMPSG
jgi:hypothetical protein